MSLPNYSPFSPAVTEAIGKLVAEGIVFSVEFAYGRCTLRARKYIEAKDNWIQYDQDIGVPPDCLPIVIRYMHEALNRKEKELTQALERPTKDQISFGIIDFVQQPGAIQLDGTLAMETFAIIRIIDNGQERFFGAEKDEAVKAYNRSTSSEFATWAMQYGQEMRTTEGWKQWRKVQQP